MNNAEKACAILELEPKMTQKKLGELFGMPVATIRKVTQSYGIRYGIHQELDPVLTFGDEYSYLEKFNVNPCNFNDQQLNMIRRIGIDI